LVLRAAGPLQEGDYIKCPTCKGTHILRRMRKDTSSYYLIYRCQKLEVIGAIGGQPMPGVELHRRREELELMDKFCEFEKLLFYLETHKDQLITLPEIASYTGHQDVGQALRRLRKKGHIILTSANCRHLKPKQIIYKGRQSS